MLIALYQNITTFTTKFLQNLICDSHTVVRSLKIASTQNIFVQNLYYTKEITKKSNYFSSIITTNNKMSPKIAMGINSQSAFAIMENPQMCIHRFSHTVLAI